jgi:hypothetical protein
MHGRRAPQNEDLIAKKEKLRKSGNQIFVIWGMSADNKERQ